MNFMLLFFFFYDKKRASFNASKNTLLMQRHFKNKNLSIHYLKPFIYLFCHAINILESHDN